MKQGTIQQQRGIEIAQ